MTTEEILKIQGIVIRLIPVQTISLYEKRRFENKENQELIYHEGYKRTMCREVNKNSLGGKYLVHIDQGQSSMVQFSKLSGMGDTIQEAYSNYLKLNERVKNETI